MTTFPGPSGWIKNQDSDTLSTFVGGFNLDLTKNKTNVRVSPRMKIGTNDIANLGVAVGFERFNGGSGQNGIFTVAGDRVFSTSSTDASATFAESSGTGTSHSSDSADIMFFKAANLLVTTMQTTLQSHNGTSWSTVAGSPLVGGPVHMLTQYGLRGYVISDRKDIISFDTSMNTTATGNPNTFVLGALSSNNVGLTFSDILAAQSFIWLFTINGAVGQPGRVYTWDGATQNTPINGQGYILDSGGVWAAVLINDNPVIINTEGRLQMFNGGTFQDVPNGRLPFNKDKFLKNAFSSVNDRPIHPRGLKLFPGNKLRVLVNNVYEDGTIDEFFPAGEYEFDLDNKALGWYHINSPSLYASSVTDYGQQRVSRVGGLGYFKTPTGAGISLIGAQVYSDATNTKEIIATEETGDTVVKYGSIIYPKFYSSEITSTFQKAFVRLAKKLLTTGDEITLKYRTNEVDPTEVTITWVDTNTFTTTGDISAYVVGDEVEITQGEGGGKCAHISVISNNTGTYTVDLDSTFTGVTTNTAKARFQKWTKIGSFTDRTIQTFEGGIGTSSEWIQIKMCMQFTGKNEVHDLKIANTPNQKIQ